MEITRKVVVATISNAAHGRMVVLGCLDVRLDLDYRSINPLFHLESAIVLATGNQKVVCSPVRIGFIEMDKWKSLECRVLANQIGSALWQCAEFKGSSPLCFARAFAAFLVRAVNLPSVRSASESTNALAASPERCLSPRRTSPPR